MEEITMDKELLEEIVREFGRDAEEIISRIYCGQSVDSAIQSVVCSDN